MIKVEPLLKSVVNSDDESDSESEANAFVPITKSEIAENLQQQREKQYRHICKVEQQSTNPVINSINTLQEPDMQELVKLIEIYMLRSLALINASDSVLSVKLKDPLRALPKSMSLSSANTITNSVNSYSDIRQIMTNRKEEDYTLRIDSMISLDLLRNGLKSGNPFAPHQDMDAKISAAKEASKMASSLAGNKLMLKYQLTIDANRSYFEIMSDKLATDHTRENLALYKVGVSRKPPAWSQFDYDQISLEVLLNKRKPSGRTKNRYLNSRALFDRLLHYFSHVLKYDFPTRQAASTAMSTQTNIGKNMSSMSKSHMSKSTQTTSQADPTVAPVDLETRTCHLKNNQLIVNFKLDQGFRSFKQLEVCLIINIGIRCEHNNLLNDTIENVIAHLVQEYQPYDMRQQNNGNNHFQPPDVNSFVSCLRSVFHSEFNHFFLVPTLVHYWSVDLRHTKINMIKYLIYTYSVPLNRRMSDLVSLNPEKSSQHQLGKYGRFNTNMLTASSAPMFIFFKSLQNFLSQTFVAFVVFNNMTDLLSDSNSLQYEVEELTVNVFLATLTNLEINLTKFTAECIFDIMWSTLVKLRVDLFENNRVADPFNVLASVTPSFILRLGGYLNLGSQYDCRVVNILDELRFSFENNLRTFFKAVVGDDLVPKDEDQEKELNQAATSSLVTKNLESVSVVMSTNILSTSFNTASKVQSMAEVAAADVQRVVKNLKKPNASRLSNLGSEIRMEEV